MFNIDHLVFWHWFGLAAFLGLLDVALGANFFFVWCGAAAGILGIITWVVPQLMWEYQILIFSIGVFVFLGMWHHYVKNHKAAHPHTLNRRTEQYIGQLFVLEEPIVNGMGKVRVADSLWKAQSTQDLPKGQTVRVISVNGVILLVEPA